MKIRIDSYKNIHNLTIPVHDNKLILLGNNGVGKTNTLEAVYFEKCVIEDAPYEYKKRYMMSLETISMDDYFPNANILRKIFPDITIDNLQYKLMQFLEEAYTQLNRHLLKKLVQDALDTLTYCIANKQFDTSPIAITRLIILKWLYRESVRTGDKYIILADSPELFAHPMLMNEITNALLDLSKRGCLVIITTHNEYVISRFFSRFEEIVKIEKDANGNARITTIDMDEVKERIREFYRRDEYLTHSFSRMTHPDDGLIKLLNDDIENFLITAFRDRIITIFFAETVVLGEGASEDVLFDYINNVLQPQWVSDNRTGFMNCMGKSTMPLYFVFLNYLNVRTLVIYDLDNTNNLVHAAYRKCFDDYHFEHPSLFASYYLSPDLERYLDIDNGQRIRSLVKPLNVFNYTYMQEEVNPRVNELVDIMELNIQRMKEAAAR